MDIVETRYIQSEPSNATIVCIGGVECHEAISIWEVRNSIQSIVYEQQYPHSIGIWFAAMEKRIGLDHQKETLLELAKQGDPNRLFLEVLHDFIATTGCGWSPCTEIKQDLRNGCMWWHPELYTKQDMLDVAAATQQVYVYILQNIVAWRKANLPSNNLVLQGRHPLREADIINLYQFYNQIYVTS